MANQRFFFELGQLVEDSFEFLNRAEARTNCGLAAHALLTILEPVVGHGDKKREEFMRALMADYSPELAYHYNSAPLEMLVKDMWGMHAQLLLVARTPQEWARSVIPLGANQRVHDALRAIATACTQCAAVTQSHTEKPWKPSVLLQGSQFTKLRVLSPPSS